jgi:polysaccharide biosynthesis/export protein
VQQPTSHTFNETMDVKAYLERSGGLKARADEDRIYIVKADGSVFMPKNNWFDTTNETLEAGDTIVVPLDSEYMSNLQTWSSATQILYNTSVAIAAIGTLL